MLGIALELINGCVTIAHFSRRTEEFPGCLYESVTYFPKEDEEEELGCGGCLGMRTQSLSPFSGSSDIQGA